MRTQKRKKNKGMRSGNGSRNLLAAAQEMGKMKRNLILMGGKQVNSYMQEELSKKMPQPVGTISSPKTLTGSLTLILHRDTALSGQRLKQI